MNDKVLGILVDAMEGMRDVLGWAMDEIEREEQREPMSRAEQARWVEEFERASKEGLSAIMNRDPHCIPVNREEEPSPVDNGPAPECKGGENPARTDDCQVGFTEFLAGG